MHLVSGSWHQLLGPHSLLWNCPASAHWLLPEAYWPCLHSPGFECKHLSKHLHCSASSQWPRAQSSISEVAPAATICPEQAARRQSSSATRPLPHARSTMHQLAVSRVRRSTTGRTAEAATGCAGRKAGPRSPPDSGLPNPAPCPSGTRAKRSWLARAGCSWRGCPPQQRLDDNMSSMWDRVS